MMMLSKFNHFLLRGNTTTKILAAAPLCRPFMTYFRNRNEPVEEEDEEEEGDEDAEALEEYNLSMTELENTVAFASDAERLENIFFQESKEKQFKSISAHRVSQVLDDESVVEFLEDLEDPTKWKAFQDKYTQFRTHTVQRVDPQTGQDTQQTVFNSDPTWDDVTDNRNPSIDLVLQALSEPEPTWFTGEDMRIGLARVEQRTQEALSSTLLPDSPDRSKVYRRAQLMDEQYQQQYALVGDYCDNLDRGQALVWYLDSVERKKYVDPDASNRHSRMLRVFVQEHQIVSNMLREFEEISTGQKQDLGMKQVMEKYASALRGEQFMERLKAVQQAYSKARVAKAMKQLDAHAYLRETFDFAPSPVFLTPQEEKDYYTEQIESVEFAVNQVSTSESESSGASESAGSTGVPAGSSVIGTTGTSAASLAPIGTPTISTKAMERSREESLINNTLISYEPIVNELSTSGKKNNVTLFLQEYAEQLERILIKSVVLMAKFDAIIKCRDTCEQMYKICRASKATGTEEMKKIVRVCKRSVEDYRILNQPFQLSRKPFYYGSIVSDVERDSVNQ